MLCGTSPDLDIPPYPSAPLDLEEDDGDYVLAAATGIRNGVIGGILAWLCLGACIVLLVRVILGW